MPAPAPGWLEEPDFVESVTVTESKLFSLSVQRAKAMIAQAKTTMYGQETPVRYLQDTTTRTQHERLKARIESLGGSTSTSKSVLAHVLAFAPTLVPAGQTRAEKNTQHLMNVIATAAAGDVTTEQLARAPATAGTN